MEKFIHVDRCDSTQELLKEQLSSFPDHELTVSCNFQAKGKGRGSNIWQDDAGTICFSMTLPPHTKPSLTALEISLLVLKYFDSKGQKFHLKWPNDLINHQGKKCGGILIQNTSNRYIAGIGLNLFFAGDDFGGVFSEPFTVNKEEWCKDLSHYIRTHRYQSTERLSHEWTEVCFHLNQEVRITDLDNEIIGTFKGLGTYGEALIENSQGIHHVYNGSLRLV